MAAIVIAEAPIGAGWKELAFRELGCLELSYLDEPPHLLGSKVRLHDAAAIAFHCLLFAAGSSLHPPDSSTNVMGRSARFKLNVI